MNARRLPLETFDLFPARILEAGCFAAGHIGPEAYPEWVRTLTRDLARRILPKAWRADAAKRPDFYVRGFFAGFALHICDAGFDVLVPKEKRPHMNRVARTAAVPFVGLFDFEKITPEQFVAGVTKAVRKEATDAMTRSRDERTAFFRGFTLGNDFDRALENAFPGKPKTSVSDTLVLKAYLWLRWPDFVALDSIQALHTKCRRAFASIGQEKIVGTPESFRRFCNRIGLSYRERQRAKRPGQKRHPELSVMR